jgi:hypothetical protein
MREVLDLSRKEVQCPGKRVYACRQFRMNCTLTECACPVTAVSEVVREVHEGDKSCVAEVADTFPEVLCTYLRSHFWFTLSVQGFCSLTGLSV